MNIRNLIGTIFESRTKAKNRSYKIINSKQRNKVC